VHVMYASKWHNTATVKSGKWRAYFSNRKSPGNGQNDSNDLADQCFDPHDVWNFNTVQETFDLRNATPSCYRLHMQNPLMNSNQTVTQKEGAWSHGHCKMWLSQSSTYMCSCKTCAKMISYIFIPSDLDRGPFNFKSAPPVTHVQGHISN